MVWTAQLSRNFFLTAATVQFLTIYLRQPTPCAHTRPWPAGDAGGADAGGACHAAAVPRAVAGAVPGGGRPAPAPLCELRAVQRLRGSAAGPQPACMGWAVNQLGNSPALAADHVLKAHCLGAAARRRTAWMSPPGGWCWWARPVQGCGGWGMPSLAGGWSSGTGAGAPDVKRASCTCACATCV